MMSTASISAASRSKRARSQSASVPDMVCSSRLTTTEALRLDHQGDHSVLRLVLADLALDPQQRLVRCALGRGRRDALDALASDAVPA